MLTRRTFLGSAAALACSVNPPVVKMGPSEAESAPSSEAASEAPIVDAAAYLGALSEANGGAGKEEVSAFFRWVGESLFASPPARLGGRRGGAQGLCGLSIFVPRSARESRRYRALDLYGATRLPELWERVTAPPAPKREPTLFSR